MFLRESERTRFATLKKTGASMSSNTQPSFDKAALLAKYRVERDKRLRNDGNAQYLEIKGQLAHYLEDPYTPLTER
ncbi:MAG: hypothetical protein ACI9YG_002171, partial [Candidatus Azotimanducaceae bacterium]